MDKWPAVCFLLHSHIFISISRTGINKSRAEINRNPHYLYLLERNAGRQSHITPRKLVLNTQPASTASRGYLCPQKNKCANLRHTNKGTCLAPRLTFITNSKSRARSHDHNPLWPFRWLGVRHILTTVEWDIRPYSCTMERVNLRSRIDVVWDDAVSTGSTRSVMPKKPFVQSSVEMFLLYWNVVAEWKRPFKIFVSLLLTLFLCSMTGKYLSFFVWLIFSPPRFWHYAFLK